MARLAKFSDIGLCGRASELHGILGYVRMYCGPGGRGSGLAPLRRVGVARQRIRVGLLLPTLLGEFLVMKAGLVVHWTWGRYP